MNEWLFQNLEYMHCTNSKNFANSSRFQFFVQRLVTVTLKWLALTLYGLFFRRVTYATVILLSST